MITHDPASRAGHRARGACAGRGLARLMRYFSWFSRNVSVSAVRSTACLTMVGAAVAGVALDAEQDRRRSGCVAWSAAAILRACIGSTRSSLSAESTRIGGIGRRARLTPVVGRVRVRTLNCAASSGRAVLRHPRLAAPEQVVAQHVEERHRAHHGAEQLGALRDRRADEQAAVRAAADREAGRARCSRSRSATRPPRRSRRRRSACSRAHAGLVPVLAVLATAAQVGQREDAAAPRATEMRAGREARRELDVEAAVAVEQERVEPSCGSPLRCTTNIEIGVPSFDG